MAKTESTPQKGIRTSYPIPDGMRTRAAIDPIILVVIAGIAILAVVVFLVMSSSSPPVPAVSAQRCGDQTLSYVNDNLATEGTTATLVKAEDQHGMYRVTVAYQGQQIPLYTTTDCTLLFTEAMEMGASQPGVTASACGDRMLSYVNQNLAAEGTAATPVSVEDQHGMYRVTVAYQGQQYPFYATPDCTLLFLEGMDMTAPEATPTPAATPVQTDRPAVDLFVMSYCPYGTQAEAAMKPVADLLGAKADIRVRYITSVGGTTVDSIESLHGAVEAQEDLRQACIEKYSPMKFWGYLAGFNSECYSTARTPESAAACSKNVTSALGIDQAEIDACATGAEGIGLLSTDVASAMVQDATASPTLLINGVEFSGSRSPEAYKQAICGSFTNAPAECETKLSEQQASVGGTC